MLGVLLEQVYSILNLFHCKLSLLANFTLKFQTSFHLGGFFKKTYNVGEIFQVDNTIIYLQLSSEWKGRIATRMGSLNAGSLAVIQMLLPGAACIYYGDELAMLEVDLTKEHSPHSKVGLINSYLTLYLFTLR